MTASPFCSLNTTEIPIPGMPGHAALIRQISSLRAREAWSSRHDPAWRDTGWMAEVDELSRRARGDLADPLSGFWPPAVLSLGVVSWSLGPVDDATIGQLAPHVVTGLAREVMRFAANPETAETAQIAGHR